MTGIPAASDDNQPREWSIGNRTLIIGAGSRRVLAVLNGRDPLLLPPGSVLQFGDPLVLAEPCHRLDSVVEYGLHDAVHPAVEAVIGAGCVLQ
jgi:hypothetical protein